MTSSDYLYARPSFAEGISRLVDFGGTLQVYNESPDDYQADYLALLSDWRIIGDDIKNTMVEYGKYKGQIGEESPIETHES
jgi:hypothetical protein